MSSKYVELMKQSGSIYYPFEEKSVENNYPHSTRQALHVEFWRVQFGGLEEERGGGFLCCKEFENEITNITAKRILFRLLIFG